MTNGEKYKTAEERTEEFDKFCHAHAVCRVCKLRGTEQDVNKTLCVFRWLNTNDEPSIAEIVEGMRTMKKEEVVYTWEKWKALCDSLDAAAKRAYEKIGKEMHGTHGDIMYMRKIMNETIGGYNV